MPGVRRSHRDDAGAAVVDNLRAAEVGRLHETVGGVVVHDLGSAVVVDVDLEEVGQGAIAGGDDAGRPRKTDVVVVHGVRGGLVQRGRRCSAGLHVTVAIGSYPDLG